MVSDAQAETALLTEHMKYTPLALIDEIIDTINDLSNRAIDGAEKGIMDASPANLGYADKAKAEKRSVQKDKDGHYIFPEAEGELRDGIHKLETLLQTNIDINFDKFEIVALRSILHVPNDLYPWLRLAHYESIPQVSSSQQTYSPEELNLLRQKVRETKKLKQALETTIAQNNGIISAIRSLTNPGVEGQTPAGPLAFLCNAPAAQQLGIKTSPNGNDSMSTPGPFETNVSFAISQLPALRALVDDLRPRLAGLSSTAGQPTAESELARERRAYVEAQSRRAVERQGMGTETGALDALGRVVNPEELASLEQLTGALQQPTDEDETG